MIRAVCPVRFAGRSTVVAVSPSTVQAPEQTAQAVMDALSRIASPERAASSARFFKTGPGEYGEGDLFVGVTVPDQRKVLRSFRICRSPELTRLIGSPFTNIGCVR